MCATRGASPGLVIRSSRAPERSVRKWDVNDRLVLEYFGPVVALNHRSQKAHARSRLATQCRGLLDSPDRRQQAFLYESRVKFIQKRINLCEKPLWLRFY